MKRNKGDYMDIIQLMDEQQRLEAQIAELKTRFPLNDNDECLKFAALNKEVEDIESQICMMAKAVDADPAIDYSGVTDAFAQAINAAAEKGTPVEDVIFGKDSIIDLETVSCMFKIVRSEGKCYVVGGELSAQCKAFPWLLIKVSVDGVYGDPIWVLEGRMGRPNLKNGVGCLFNLDGSYQRGVLAFFRREYARQRELDATRNNV